MNVYRLLRLVCSVVMVMIIGCQWGSAHAVTVSGIDAAVRHTPDQKYGIPIQMQMADVTGDGKQDRIVLYGTKQIQSSPYFDHLSIVIHSESSELATVIPIQGGGYNPYMKLCDLNGDGVADMLIGAETGGSAGTSDYYLFTDKNNDPAALPLPQALSGSGTYMDNYIVTITIKETGKVYKLDLSDRKALYEQEGIYKNGKLVKKTDVIINGFSKLEPIHAVTETQCSLVGLQRISGIYNADTIGYLVSLWKWNHHINKWSLLFSTIEESK